MIPATRLLLQTWQVLRLRKGFLASPSSQQPVLEEDEVVVEKEEVEAEEEERVIQNSKEVQREENN